MLSGQLRLEDGKDTPLLSTAHKSSLLASYYAEGLMLLETQAELPLL